MNDSSPSSPENSAEDTYNVLRRAPYEQACVEYTLACMYLHSTATREQLTTVADPILEKFGWSVDDLYVESRRREKAIQIVRK